MKRFYNLKGLRCVKSNCGSCPRRVQQASSARAEGWDGEPKTLAPSEGGMEDTEGDH